MPLSNVARHVSATTHDGLYPGILARLCKRSQGDCSTAESNNPKSTRLRSHQRDSSRIFSSRMLSGTAPANEITLPVLLLRKMTPGVPLIPDLMPSAMSSLTLRIASSDLMHARNLLGSSFSEVANATRGSALPFAGMPLPLVWVRPITALANAQNCGLPPSIPAHVAATASRVAIGSWKSRGK